MFKKATSLFYENPKKLFLIDGLGAISSAFLLGIILVKLEAIFGIPASTLYLLAAFPVLFAIYDFFSYRTEKSNYAGLLKGIAIFNMLYCFLSIGFAVFHFDIITLWGWAYILGEVLIVVLLAIIELRVANRLKTLVKN